MKTLFALLGLFMFASVSSTDLVVKDAITTESAVLLESGDGYVGPRKKADIGYNQESGDGYVGPRKKADIGYDQESGDGFVSNRKKADIV